MTDGTASGGLEAELVIRRDAFALDVTLSVPPRTTLVLLGPNGAGKSTVVDAIAGLAPLHRGRVVLGDRVLDEPAADRFMTPEERNIGVVFQDYLLFDHLSVADNVAFPLRHRPGRRLSRRAARAEVAPLLRDLELDDLADLEPDRLSGGQAQRVALARAMAGRPDLLLLDEPLAAVDVSTRTRLRRLLIDHLDRFPGPRVVITHDPAEAFALADRLAVIEDGSIVQQGEPAELQRHPATPWVATLTGSNLLAGRAASSRIDIDGADFMLTTATDLEGPVNAVIDPRAVALYREQPAGSPRNTWRTTIEWVEPLGRTARVRLGSPLPLNVDITPSAAEALGLGPGVAVWAAVKATEIRVVAR